MIKKTLYCVLFIYTFSYAKYPSCALTNIEGGGVDRLGDRLVQFIKCKLIEYRTGIPFLLTPFTNANKLKLFELNQHIPSNVYNFYCTIVRVRNQSRYIQYDDNILYGIDFNCELLPFKDTEEAEQFRQKIKQEIAPQEPIKLDCPKDAPSVALHMRKGSHKDRPLKSSQYYASKPALIIFDDQPHPFQEPNVTNKMTLPPAPGNFADVLSPFRFVPNQYYIDQLILLSTILGNPSLHVFIFTDDAHPEQLVSELQHHIPTKNMVFHYRTKENNAAGNHVIEDLFLMSQCTYMIRARSHLAHIAEYIGEHQIVIFPHSYEWHDNNLVITKAAIKLYNQNLRSLFEIIKQ